MKRRLFRPGPLGTAAFFLLLPFNLLRADVFYSGLQNIAIPAAFEGVYLNVDTRATGNAAGWDINAVFGGGRVYSSDRFQPARIGTGNEDAIIALSAGAAVGSSRVFSTGYGASDRHLGAATNQFQPGQEAYLGFRFSTDANSALHYGWMRVVFTANEPGAVIRDWGYETGLAAAAPKSITAGNILQAAPSAGVSVVTLTAGSEQASTLGSVLANTGGGNVTAVSKAGAGTWTLSGNQTYTGATTVSSNGGTLEVGAAAGKLSGTASININSGGTLLLSGAGGTNVKLNSAASVTLAGGAIDLGGMSSSLNQTVGALTLSAPSAVDFGTLLAGHTLRFGASHADWSGIELSIFNYTSGADHLFFGTNMAALNAAQLDRILFYSDDGSTLLGSARWINGIGEVAPVPEPGTWAAGLLTVGALAYTQRRRWKPRIPRSSACLPDAKCSARGLPEFEIVQPVASRAHPRRIIC